MSENTNTAANDRTIDDATPDDQITGVEKFPVSDNGAPKYATITKVKNYVIAQLTDSEFAPSVTLANDKIYVVQNGITKKYGADDFAESLIAFIYGKSAAGSLTGNEKVSLMSGNNAKTLTTSALASYVRSTITNSIDIHGLSATANPLSDSDETAVAQGVTSQGTTTWSSFKATLSSIASYVIGKLRGSATESSASLDNNDEIVAFVGANNTLSRVKLSNAGLGTGNVRGPSANTNEKIPQWDGANSKTLKDGLAVVKSAASDPITSGSSDTEVPTAAAVYQHVNTVATSAANAAVAPNSTTESNVPQWDSTQKHLKNGLGVRTIIRSAENASNTDIPTEKAVANAIDGKGDVTGPNVAADNNIVMFNGSTGKTIKDSGFSIVTDMSTESATTIPNSVAVADYVEDAIDDLGDVHGPTLTTENNIPQWDSQNKTLKNGLTLRTTIRSTQTASDSAVATEKAVATSVEARGDVFGPSSSTDGEIVRFDGSSGKSLKNGLSVDTSISSTSTNNAVPTSKAVYDYADSIGLNDKGDVFGPDSSTDEDLVQFDGTTGKLIKGGLSVVDEIGEDPTDTQIPTALAVQSAIEASGDVKADSEMEMESGTYYLASWDDEEKQITNRYSIDDDDTTPWYSGSMSDRKVPTQGCVYSHIGIMNLPHRFYDVPYESQIASTISTLPSLNTIRCYSENAIYLKMTNGSSTKWVKFTGTVFNP